MVISTKIILFKKDETLKSHEVESFIYHNYDDLCTRLKKLENDNYEVIHDFAIEIKLIRFD